MLFTVTDLVDQAEDRGLDEFNQALEHLRLAGEMAVQRGFGDIKARRQRSRGDPVPLGVLQHGSQCLQYLKFALARFGIGHGRYQSGNRRAVMSRPKIRRIRNSAGAACSAIGAGILL